MKNFLFINSIKKAALKVANKVASKLDPQSALKLARYSLLTPQRNQAAWPKYVQKMSIKTSQGKLAVYKYGQGKCVWLVHDWSSSARQSLPLMKKLASEGFSVMSFDLPAHGHSAGKTASLPRLISAFDKLANELLMPSTIMATGIGASIVTNSKCFDKFGGNLVLINPELNPYKKLQQVAKEKGVEPEILEQLVHNIARREKLNIKKLETKEKLKAFTGSIKVINNKSKQKCPSKCLKEMAWES